MTLGRDIFLWIKKKRLDSQSATIFKGTGGDNRHIYCSINECVAAGSH